MTDAATDDPTHPWGAERQRYEAAVPIEAIHPHPENVNEGDVGAISHSMAANGWYGAVLVQESTGRIIAGKHRWLSAGANGLDTIPVLWIDVDDDRARRIMLADNRTARLGRDDPQALAELLEELAAQDEGLAGTGFDGDDLDQLLEDLAAAGGEGGDGDEHGDGPPPDGDAADRSPTTGEMLAIADVSVGEPKHQVSHGQTWHLDSGHVLVIAKLLDEHHLWSPHLEGRLFVPYPEPYLTCGTLAQEQPLLLVQPNKYLAGHLLDKHVSVYGADSARVAS